jgi:hypothetical protein
MTNINQPWKQTALWSLCRKTAEKLGVKQQHIPKLLRSVLASSPYSSLSTPSLPEWFVSEADAALSRHAQDEKPLFIYVPWIKQHGDSLLQKLAPSNSYTLAPLNIFHNAGQLHERRKIIHFAAKHPALYRKMLISRLAVLRHRLAGCLFTVDWVPPMRILAEVCGELNIPRILIPHESVFINRERYYVDPYTGNSTPAADIVLGWGELQKEIFTERGYPKERISIIGTPKFDSYTNYTPYLEREIFMRIFGLSPERKTILFTAQPLDSQINTFAARLSQNRAIADLLDYGEANGIQVIIRCPPSNDEVLGDILRKRIDASPLFAIDEAFCYMVSPEEAIYHCDALTSVNSTMLFEALLMGRPAVSQKYVEFDQIWQQAGIPAVHDQQALFQILDRIFIRGDYQISDQGMTWAAQQFSNGAFDGKATQRAKSYLADLACGRIQLRAAAPS